MRLRTVFAGLLVGVIGVGSLAGQDVGSLDAQAPKPKAFVVYASEQQMVAAGKRSVLELQFRSGRFPHQFAYSKIRVCNPDTDHLSAVGWCEGRPDGISGRNVLQPEL